MIDSTERIKNLAMAIASLDSVHHGASLDVRECLIAEIANYHREKPRPAHQTNTTLDEDIPF